MTQVQFNLKDRLGWFLACHEEMKSHNALNKGFGGKEGRTKWKTKAGSKLWS